MHQNRQIKPIHLWTMSLILSLGAFSCAHSQNRSSASLQENVSLVSLGEDLSVTQLTNRVYMHVSTKHLPTFGPVPANGLVVVTSQGAVLVDTPWTNLQTRRLLAWFRDIRNVEVRELIVTHAHDDRMGGIDEAMAHKITTRGFKKTAELAIKGRMTPPQVLYDTSTSFELLGEPIEIYYPGAGHSIDNIVVWFRRSAILFGGCLVKSLAADDLGNISDADLKNWGPSIQNVFNRFHSIAWVIPGHGQPGGQDLLMHTYRLWKQHR